MRVNLPERDAETGDLKLRVWGVELRLEFRALEGWACRLCSGLPLFNPEVPSTLPLWKKVSKNHNRDGLSVPNSIIVVYMGSLGNLVFRL